MNIIQQTDPRGDKKLLQAWVPAAIHRRVRVAAALRGISTASLLSELIERGTPELPDDEDKQ